MRPSAIARLAAPAFAAACLLSGCNALPPPDLKTPRIAVSDVSVRDLGLSELRFAVTVRADNPNDVEIPLSNLKFDLDLLGRPFAQGAADDARLRLPARATREVPIEFTVPTARILDLFAAARSAGLSNLSYRLKGSANWGSSPFSIPFERSGNLDALARLRELLPLPLPGRERSVPGGGERPATI
jgi:LEA14-like dessication related protein